MANLLTIHGANIEALAVLLMAGLVALIFQGEGD